MLFDIYEDVFFKRNNISDFEKISFIRELFVSKSANFTFSKHPLGFLCLNFSIAAGKQLRVHFWDKEFYFRQIPYWPIHNHSFEFSSLILKGVIQNKKYKLNLCGSERNKCFKYKVAYNDEKSIINCSGAAYPRVDVVERVRAGEIYSMESSVYHRSRCLTDNAITLMATKTADPASDVFTLGCGNLNKLTFDRNIGTSENYLNYVLKNLFSYK